MLLVLELFGGRSIFTLLLRKEFMLLYLSLRLFLIGEGSIFVSLVIFLHLWLLLPF